jgi:hypothetical protein
VRFKHLAPRVKQGYTGDTFRDVLGGEQSMNRKPISIYFVTFIIGIIIAVGLFVAPFLLFPTNEDTLNLAIARTMLSMVTIPIIVVGFLYTTVQFRKASAKPKIKVAFNQKGEQQANIIFKNSELETKIPHPWLINEGNAVARFFQIDFVIPEKIGKPEASAYVTFRKIDGNYILSYVNEGRYTLWVDRPYQDINTIFSFVFNKDKILEYYKNGFDIEYQVYGDWAEPQQGKLKIIVINQQEASHVPAQS